MTKKKIQKSIDSFLDWHESFGNVSYDRMDFWSSKIGIIGKKIFYQNKFLGLPFAVLGLMSENFFPKIQNLFSNKHREVIGDAHFAMS